MTAASGSDHDGPIGQETVGQGTASQGTAGQGTAGQGTAGPLSPAAPAAEQALGRTPAKSQPRRYHAAVWSEPLVMELGLAGRRGTLPPAVEPAVAALAGSPEALVPARARRKVPPALPELSEWEVLRHYLRLSQQTLGMMGVSLFGTCTMKYNPAVSEALSAAAPGTGGAPAPGRRDDAGPARGRLPLGPGLA